MKKLAVICLVASTGILSAFQGTPVEESTLKLPAGFHATIFADDVGQARHLAVTPQGNVYVRLARLEDGKGTILLQDLDKDGKAEKQTRFGNFTGTGIALTNDYLYASSNQDI